MSAPGKHVFELPLNTEPSLGVLSPAAVDDLLMRTPEEHRPALLARLSIMEVEPGLEVIVLSPQPKPAS